VQALEPNHHYNNLQWGFLNLKFYNYMFKCWIMLKPVLVGVDSSLNFLVLYTNRLNQTEPATFSILLFWTFFGNSISLYLSAHNKKSNMENFVFLSLVVQVTLCSKACFLVLSSATALCRSISGALSAFSWRTMSPCIIKIYVLLLVICLLK
jgi:hypothetical protein